MEFIKTKLDGVYLISPKVFTDPRGCLFETYRENKFLESDISTHFVQDNCSVSKKNVLRGLHYQIKYPQAKLIEVILGEVIDVIVDIQKNSKTFGQWISIDLSSKNKNQIWVPIGFAHGFYVLSDVAQVFYKLTNYYSPESERCIAWNDPDLNIKWPIPKGITPELSPKDAVGKLFKDAEYF
jgi:dTDP-4-dehydrorhamnose 3,5-epimerase